MSDIGRRRFIGGSLAGLTAVVLGPERLGLGQGSASAAPLSANLTIEAATVAMIDGVSVPMWSYGASGSRPVPGPVLLATEGDAVTLTVTNRLTMPRGWAIPGLATTGQIAPGASTTVSFTAPAAGTYLYHDPVDDPIGTFMGLHGALIVMPYVVTTPYTSPTSQVRAVFDRHPWDASRQWVWLFHSVDPSFNAAVLSGSAPSPGRVIDTYTPRYYTINGLSGFDASFADDIVPHGHLDEPALIRTLNAGPAFQAPHIHGNHVWELARNGGISSNVAHRDTWLLGPRDRVDVLLPFEAPRDSYPWPPSDPFHFPMHFPMHCHMEMSQTAGGGSYPQGAVTHWTLEGL